jgi:hypothetical protein
MPDDARSNLADTLWKAADALPGQVDAAPRREAQATYMHVILGLVPHEGRLLLRTSTGSKGSAPA